MTIKILGNGKNRHFKFRSLLKFVLSICANAGSSSFLILLMFCVHFCPSELLFPGPQVSCGQVPVLSRLHCLEVFEAHQSQSNLCVPRSAFL